MNAHNEQQWPEYLMLRDTGLSDDAGGLGQRIFTTAGAGYVKKKYVRADIAAQPAAAQEFVCTGDELRCHDGHGCECAMRGLKPAAAQEAVAWQRRWADADGLWFSISKEIYEATQNGKWADRYEVRALYAAPVTAAPAGDDGKPMVLVSQEFKAQAEYDAQISSEASNLLRDNSLGLTGSLPAMVGELLKLASTPAAPGIDLAAMIRSNLRSIRSMANSLPKSFALVSSNIGHEIDHAMTLLDASPKGERVSNPDELAFAARGFLGASFAPSAEESTREMRDTYSYWHRRLLRAAGGAMDYEQATDTAADSPKGGTMNEQFGSAEELGSPKGGSEARDAAMAALVEAATAVERADADGELTDDLVDRLRAARDAAQAGDAEAPAHDAAEDRCESGSPECGPVEHWDNDGVPLCSKCWATLQAQPIQAGDAEVQP